MNLRDQLIEHLRLMSELGVGGWSRDAGWTARPADAMRLPAVTDEGGSGGAAGSGDRAEGWDALVAAAASQADLFDGGGAPSSPAAGRAGESLQEIRLALGDCTRCKLHRLGRSQIVFGVGSPRAELMFVGEAPGHDEDVQGIPFVGRAGQLLTRIIEAINLKRDDVYIANVLKCRPPGNRAPEPDETTTCEPFLFRQVSSVRPRVIVALGAYAAQALLKTKDPISRLRGRTYGYGGAKLIATFHPAFLLRSPDRKRDVWEDMKKVRALLDGHDV